MPPLSRVGDMTTGHGCFEPQQLITGSPTVFINDTPACRLGDLRAPHYCPIKTPPELCSGGTNIVAGALNVLIENIPAARVGDPIACGDIIAKGSGNVLGS